MSIWADLAGDDSNLSMAADEFVDIKNSNILSDISNSASQNRSRYDPELDNSKQGLNLQLNQFGLGNNSNSGLGKKRHRCELQGDGDTEMPPKSKQRTKGPQDFSHFLGSSSTTSSLNLSGASSCPTNLTNASSTTSIPTPTKPLNHTSDGLYAAIIGKGKSTKQSPVKTTQSPVPALVSQSLSAATTSKTSANPTPTSANTKKITSSVPSSVRRRRLMRRRMGKRKSAASSQSPTKDTETTSQDQDDDVLMEPATAEVAASEPSNNNENAPQPMEEDDKTVDSNGVDQGHTVLNTWGNGKIFLPSDIVESAKKASSLPRPSPFRLQRSSSHTSTSTSPQRLSFAGVETEEQQPQEQPVFIPTTTMSTIPFNLTNFMPLPIPSLPLSSNSVSSAATPNNEIASEATPANASGNLVNPMVSPQPMMFPFAPLAHPGIVSPQIAAPTFDTTLASVPMPFAFPMAFGNFPFPANGVPPTFIPFQPTPTPPVDTPTEIEPAVEPMSIENAASDEIAVPEDSVWAPPADEATENSSWRNKCFKSEVARNKALKVSEDAARIQKRKQDLRFKQREKDLLPLDRKDEVQYNNSYGTQKQPKSWRREYHPYDQNDAASQSKPMQVDRRARGRARTRSMSNSVMSSPDKLVWKKSDSTSASETTTSRERSDSISTDTTARQEPKPLTEERIAWRMNQIEIAKNTDGYRNYIKSLPKAQRKKNNPQTPNPKEKIAKRRWAGKYNKWRKLLHEFDVEGGEEGVEGMVGASNAHCSTESFEPVPPPPSSVCDANECPIILECVDDHTSLESMDVDNRGSEGHDVKQHDAIDA